MAERPTGTVTFLFTDIEGSTQSWESAASEMERSVELHDGIVRGVVEQRGGYVFATGGDGFAVAFDRADQAVAAVQEVQRRLAMTVWPLEEGLAVRAGLHTGEAQERGGDYFGPAVNKAARIAGAAHGGQILVSATTAQIVDTESLLDLGDHHLQGIERAERLFQLGDGVFPPLRSRERRAHNLPVRSAGLVGREVELEDVASLVERERLVTVVGPGGVGKTSLVSQVGLDLVDRYQDGVWLVDLAPVADEAFVLSAVADVLGLGAQGTGANLGLVQSYLTARQVLLIVDNCEHLIEAVASVIASLLGACPEVAVLATRREPLHLDGEHVVPLDPLAVQATDGSDGPAVELFRQRVAMLGHQPGDSPDEDGRVRAICARLDGLPLAIELAAARLRFMSLTDLNSRLDQRFKLLTRGSRTALPRQRTLEATVAWSYEQLEPETQRLFDGISVFAGGFTADAVMAVLGLDEFDVLDALARLVDRSLLTVHEDPDGSGRYSMLETMRHFGRERLIISGAIDRIRDRHLSWLVDLIQRHSSEIDAGVSAVTRTVDVELANIRLALTWAADDPTRVSEGLKLATALGRYWYFKGLCAEGAEWIDSLIAHKPELDPYTKTQVLSVLGYNLAKAGQDQRSLDVLDEALTLARTLDNPRLLATALASLVNAGVMQRDAQELFDLTQEGLDLAAAVDDDLLTYRHSMANVVLHMLHSGPETAQRVCQDAIRTFGNSPSLHQAGHVHEIAGGWMALHLNETNTARQHLRVALPAYRDANDANCTCHALETVAWLLASEGDTETAGALAATIQSLRLQGAHQRTDAESIPHNHTQQLLGNQTTNHDNQLFADLLAGLDYTIDLLSPDPEQAEAD